MIFIIVKNSQSGFIMQNIFLWKLEGNILIELNPTICIPQELMCLQTLGSDVRFPAVVAKQALCDVTQVPWLKCKFPIVCVKDMVKDERAKVWQWDF